MTITSIGTGTAANATNGGSITPTRHASTTTGDLVVVMVGQKNSPDYTTIAESGATYTRLIGFNGSSGSSLTLWGKIMTASESDPAFSSSDTTAGRTLIGQAHTFRGTLDTVTGIVAHSATGSGATASGITTPALTITTDNTLVIAAGIRENQWAAEDIAALATMTKIGQPERTSAQQVAMIWDYVIQTTAANIASGAWTSTVNSTDYAACVVSIKSAVAATGHPASRRFGHTPAGVSNVRIF